MPRKALLVGAAIAALLGPMGADAHAQVFGARPVVNSFDAQQVTTTSAKLSAQVTYNEKAGSFWFTYCRVSDCAQSTVDTPRQDDNPEDDAGAIVSRTVQWPVDGLRPGTQYQVTVHAGNDTHYFDATERTFTFSTGSPNVTVTADAAATTGGATQVAAATATLTGFAVAGTTGGSGIGATSFFEWGEAGALSNSTAPQALPADANPYPMTAGLSGLTPAHDYSYRLVVVRQGRRHPGAVRTFRTIWAPTCATGTTYQTARFDRIVATGCFTRDGDRWVADGAVRMNGVLLEPVGTGHGHAHTLSGGASALQRFLDGGNRLYIDRPGHALGTTGRWKLSVEHLPGFSAGTLDLTGLQWGGTQPLLSLGADENVELFDFPLAGRLSFTPSADGSSRLGVLVSLPLPRLDSVTGEGVVKVNPGGDLALDKLRLEVGALPVRGFELGNLKFVYDASEDQWEGAAEVTLPTPSAVRVSAAVVVKHRAFSSFDGAVDNLNQHLAYGIYLQRVGVHVGVDPIQLGGSIGLTAGPKVDGIGILGVRGDFLVSGPDTRYLTPPGTNSTVRIAYPGSIGVTGTGTIFDIPVRTASATWYFSPTPWFEASTSLGLDIDVGDLTLLSGNATLAGGLYGTNFELSGDLSGVVAGFDVAHASAIVGTNGMGACGSLLGVGAIGAYHAWRGGWNVVDWCGMRPLRDAIAGVASASSAGAKPLALPAGHSALVRFVGRGGAPQVRLHGPGGRTIDTPAAGKTNAARQGDFISVRDDKDARTDVLLTKPAAGWSYEVPPGSAPVRDVQTAAELPKLRIAAHVHGHGRRARLSWRLGRLAGRRVTFMESGPGAPPRVLARTTASSGSVRFTPYLTAQRERTIVALVDQDGKPRGRKVVARYVAPEAPHVTAVRALEAVRRGGAVKVSWQRMAASAKYRVISVDASGRRTLHTVKAARLTLHGPVRRVSVRAVGFDLQAGKAHAVKVR